MRDKCRVKAISPLGGHQFYLWGIACMHPPLQKYTHLWPNPGSIALFDTTFHLRWKFSSMAMNNAYIQLIQNISSFNQWLMTVFPTHYCVWGAFSQLSGRFLPVYGQAGHKTAHSPSPMTSTPLGSCPILFEHHEMLPFMDHPYKSFVSVLKNQISPHKYLIINYKP